MTGSDEQVQVKIGAQIEGFTAGIKSVKEQLEEIKGPVPDIIDSFKGIAEALGVAFAVEKIHEFGVEVAELGEKISRLSTMTGLSTDQVQEFQFAVKMTGGDADSAGAALLRFENQLGAAQTGAGTAAAAYKALGIDLKDSTGKFKSASEIMAEVADKFSATADGALKVRYATELGSRGFANLIPVLDKGRAGLDELNGTLDKTHSKMSKEQVEDAEAAAKKMKEFDQAVLGLKESLVDQKGLEQLYQHFIDITEAMTKGITVFKEWAQEGPGGGMVKQGGIYVPAFLADKYGPNQKGGASGDYGAGAGASGDYGPVAGPEGPSKPELPPLPDKTKTDAPDLSLELAQFAADEKIAKEHYAQAAELLKQQTVNHQISKTEQVQQEQTAEDAMYHIDLQALQRKASLYDKDSIDYKKTQLQIEILEQQHTTKMAQLQTKLAQANQQAAQASYKSWMSALAPIEGAFDGMLTGILQGTETISQALSNAFANAAISVVESILKIIAEWLVFEAVTEGQGTWKDFVAIQGGEGGFAGGIGKILGFEVGTPSVPSTGLAMIHQGEMILPPDISAQVRAGNATVGSAGSFGGSYSDGGTNVHITVQAIDTQTGMQFIHQMAPQIAQAIKGQVRNGNPSVVGMRV